MKRTVDVAVPLGPVHPCWKEPIRIKCETKGELVYNTEVELGYMKKGIERIMQGRPWQEVMFLAERVCGICSVVHNMVFTETMEAISGIAPPERAALLRVIVNELDRIQSHLIANFSYCYTIEHETIGMYLLNEREHAMDMIEMITGNRVNTAYMIPGGVRYDLQPEDENTLRTTLDLLERNIRRYTQMFEDGPMIGLRSRGVGVLTRDEALEAHAVGPTARASGIDVDMRTSHPTYQKLDFKPIIRTECDNYARIMVRFEEIIQSINLIRKALSMKSDGLVRGGGICQGGEMRYSGEAPRGELTYFVKADRYGRVEEIAIQTPSIMNIDACSHYMLKRARSIADVTSSFISSDPCVACTER
ncbi:hydrogenase large subunit [Methanofollis fontis]|uniref:NADH-quinone oxidoreductase subunit D domain-containing protein n=1 Tax=Methanofollis fontis TaxID=2052832 RepID=A0A483CNA5_9EURY|nr:nickel-dependent hydrogenase large subunit [Methanofollis fontis]TAJ44102.1 hypothetical protein CUJ86_08705 [Methanofollis fontis]